MFEVYKHETTIKSTLLQKKYLFSGPHLHPLRAQGRAMAVLKADFVTCGGLDGLVTLDACHKFDGSAWTFVATMSFGPRYVLTLVSRIATNMKSHTDILPS